MEWLGVQVPLHSLEPAAWACFSDELLDRCGRLTTPDVDFARKVSEKLFGEKRLLLVQKRRGFPPRLSCKGSVLRTPQGQWLLPTKAKDFYLFTDADGEEDLVFAGMIDLERFGFMPEDFPRLDETNERMTLKYFHHLVGIR